MTAMTNTVEMSPELRAELTRFGWDPERVTWGHQVTRDGAGILLEREGGLIWRSGPLVVVSAGDQAAVVREGWN